MCFQSVEADVNGVVVLDAVLDSAGVVRITLTPVTEQDSFTLSDLFMNTCYESFISTIPFTTTQTGEHMAYH